MTLEEYLKLLRELILAHPEAAQAQVVSYNRRGDHELEPAPEFVGGYVYLVGIGA